MLALIVDAADDVCMPLMVDAVNFSLPPLDTRRLSSAITVSKFRTSPVAMCEFKLTPVKLAGVAAISLKVLVSLDLMTVVFVAIAASPSVYRQEE